MNEQEQQTYLENYKKAKEKGVPFFPDILFKDAIVALVVFLVLIALAYFLGAPLEARANPGDTSYTPRPEWYFLFLFQLLKYFPPSLEVIGVVVIPTIAILLLFALPFLDRSPRRHFLGRPVITGVTTLLMIGIVYLTVQSITEAPPPAAAAEGDQTALLYTDNCAPCHGSATTIPQVTNLHTVIAQGKHEGMPAWSADLTSDQIDSLVGFILSPEGSKLFTDNCAACHEAPELVAGDPLSLKRVLEEGTAFPAHADVDIPAWEETLTQAERTALLNFLVAPDGQRLFAVDCAPCHGRAVAFTGGETELRNIISQGGLHLEMPPWQERLSDAQIDTLARYVVDPASTSDGADLFGQYCAACHGERIPAAASVEAAREIIATGGAHETMPVWGNVLTDEQLDALVSYTLEAAQGTPLEVGQELFVDNCSFCHGEFGEGGVNPTRPDDIIAPISSAEYLKTRDNFTLQSIISQGQPNFGMSPFGSAYGGPLDDDQIDAIVAYMRSWEANPPVELPPEISTGTVSLNGKEIYLDLCAQCHGENGEGLIGPAFAEEGFQSNRTDQEIFDTINLGHEATAMIAWGEILSSDQITQLVEYIRQFQPATAPTVEPTQGATPTEAVGGEPATPASEVSFATDVQPILQARCAVCHGSFGGWDASTYDLVMTSGDNAPTVIPGDVDGSLLAQKLLNTQTIGGLMPPGNPLPDEEIQIILDWIAGGALDN